MRAAGTPPVHIAGRGQDGGLQLHRGVVQSRPSPFWHPLSIPNRLRDADAQGDQNDLSDKPSTKPGQLHDKVHQRRPPKTIVLDMDSSESPTYGEQEGSAYNGHFGCTCYHPLFVFNQFGDVERSALRPGNVHSADGWRVVLEPVIARYRGSVKRLYFRGDAAFANPEIYEFLEGEN